MMSKEIEVVDIETKKVEETKQNTQDSKQVKIQVLTLGEIVVKFEMPQNFIDEINNVFDEKDVTEVSRVELTKPTIIRVNEPHQVVIDKGWRFPRVAATVGFKDEDRLTI